MVAMNRTLVALLLVALHPLVARSAAKEEEIQAKCEAYMQARTKLSKFSGSVLLARDGKVLYSKGFGYANVEHGIPNTPQTKFRLASVSKQFCAVGIMILEHEGKLKVDDPISKHYPAVPEAWGQVTLRQLMSHTGGVPENLRVALFKGMWGQPVDVSNLLKVVEKQPLDFKPGEKWSYSNTGYALLGLVIERITGKPYGEFLKERIFDPLGMKDTGIDHRRLVLKNRASGYGMQRDELVHAQYIDLSQVYAAGSMYSTVEDLLKWDNALYTDKILPQKSLEQMWTPVKQNYGYGWIVRRTMDKKLITHDGGLPGFVTTVWRFPEEKVFVAVLCNLEGSVVHRVARDLAAIALGEPYDVPVERIEAKIGATALLPLEGEYRFGPNRILKVTRRGDELYAQMTGQGRFRLFAQSPTVYFARVDEILATFSDFKNGQATTIVLHQNGRDVAGKRLKPEIPWYRPDLRTKK